MLLNILVFPIRAINGVKDMTGFRQTFNLSYSDGNETAQCEDDVEASAVLVGKDRLSAAVSD